MSRTSTLMPSIVERQIFVASMPKHQAERTIYLDCVFRNVDARNVGVFGSRFVRCRFESCNFSGCTWSGIAFEQCVLEKCTWRDSDIHAITMAGSRLQMLQWRGCRLADYVMSEVEGSSLSMEAIEASHVSMVGAKIESMALVGGRWRDTSIIGGTLTLLRGKDVELERFIVGQGEVHDAEIVSCTGRNVRWIDCDIEAMQVTDCVFEQAAWSHSRWRGGSIHASQLPLVSFDSATLDGLAMTEVSAPRAMFDGAAISRCAWAGLHAPGASLREAKLSEADLAYAQLRGLDARGASLVQVRLNHAVCDAANLSGQPRVAWQAARTDGAAFDAPSDPAIRAWWQRNQPGARGVVQ